MSRLGRIVLLPVILAGAAWDAPAAPSAAPTFSHPTVITNAFAPFRPGAVNVLTGRTAGRDLVIVTLHLPETRLFSVGGAPVECVTIQETEFEDGALVELSLNYFAQGDDGAVYSFGEVSNEWLDGQVVSHEGSWLVGGPTQASDASDIATALAPSVLMPAAPQLGDAWKPEHVPAVADETAVVEATGGKAKVRAGVFTDVMEVEETGAAPDLETEHKWYAPGVGLVKSKGQGERLQLASTTFSQP